VPDDPDVPMSGVDALTNVCRISLVAAHAPTAATPRSWGWPPMLPVSREAQAADRVPARLIERNPRKIAGSFKVNLRYWGGRALFGFRRSG
jgi:hypothetical protein